MLGSATVDLAVGLIALYILLSTVCSAACEWIMHAFQPRAGLLRKTLLGLFGAPAAGAPQNSDVDYILNHGVFGMLLGKKHPSYISAHSFATAVIDGLIPDTAAGQPTAPAVAELRKMADKLPNSAARDALLAIFDRVGQDLTEATKEIERWYADAMDRVTGIYKRQAQLVLFCAGLVLATALNADSIMLARSLATDKELRAQVAAQAAEAAHAEQGAAALLSPAEKLRNAQDALLGSAFPLGWSSLPGDVRAHPWARSTEPGSRERAWGLWRYVSKGLGLLITAAAVSFGAPFWFDLLNKVSNLRAGGPKPKRPDEDA